MSAERRAITAAEVLQRYMDEQLPAFLGINLTDVNQVGLFSERPITVAATRGDCEEIGALLKAGADVNAVGEHGNTPLHEAVGQRHLAAVSLLLEFGARVDLRNKFGDTAIDIADSHNDNNMVALLKNRK